VLWHVRGRRGGCAFSRRCGPGSRRGLLPLGDLRVLGGRSGDLDRGVELAVSVGRPLGSSWPDLGGGVGRASHAWRFGPRRSSCACARTWRSFVLDTWRTDDGKRRRRLLLLGQRKQAGSWGSPLGAPPAPWPRRRASRGAQRGFGPEARGGVSAGATLGQEDRRRGRPRGRGS
jgi:hypothetical protein